MQLVEYIRKLVESIVRQIQKSEITVSWVVVMLRRVHITFYY